MDRPRGDGVELDAPENAGQPGVVPVEVVLTSWALAEAAVVGLLTVGVPIDSRVVGLFAVTGGVLIAVGAYRTRTVADDPGGWSHGMIGSGLVLVGVAAANVPGGAGPPQSAGQAALFAVLALLALVAWWAYDRVVGFGDRGG